MAAVQSGLAEMNEGNKAYLTYFGVDADKMVS
jgi:hypothetical protein